MGIEYKKELKPGTLAGIWKINEDYEYLIELYKPDKQERQILENFSSQSRKLEWLATRTLLNELSSKVLKIMYHSTGKPYLLNDELNISISHTQGYVAVLISTCESTGIDIEPVSRRVTKIAKRFLSDDEQKYISNSQNGLLALIYWCAKEVLVKINGDRTLDFTKCLRIQTINQENDLYFTGRIQTDNFGQDFIIRHFIFNNHLVVWSAD